MNAITFPTDIVTSSARVQQALSEIVRLSCHSTGIDEYLAVAARQISDLYDASYAMVAVRKRKDEPDLKVIMVRDGVVVQSSNCAPRKSGCSCAITMHDGERYVASGFDTNIAGCPGILNVRPSAYFGHAIDDSDGNTIGVIAAFGASSLTIDTWTQPILALYAQRIGIELAAKQEAEERARMLAEKEALADELKAEVLGRKNAEETLREAIAAIPDALVVYDSQDRLVLCNDMYRSIYSKSGPAIYPGNSFRAIVEYGLKNGQYPDAGKTEAERNEWLEERIAFHSLPESHIEQRTIDGRWLSIHERRSPSGFTVGVRYDVTTLKLQNEALESQADELKRYASVASHDLQEPLRKIELFSEILKEAIDNNNKADIDRALSVMVKSAKRGRGLVKALLESARMRSREMTRERFRLDEVVKELSSFLMTGNDRNVTITYDMAPLKVYADPALITQVIQNLMTNAIRYSKPNEEAFVAVTLKPDPIYQGSWRLSIRDCGIGFDVEKKADIFAPFKRLVSRSQIDGSGVGLSTVKMIVDKHRWTIDAHSEIGVGSDFYIVIPREDAAFADDAKANAA